MKGGRVLIDGWMPEFEVVERHSTGARASPERVWRAVRTLDLAHSPVIRLLFALRSLPGILAGRERRRSLGVTMDGLMRSGFVLLQEREKEEIVLGLIGRFWRPTGGIVRVTEEEFRAFDSPGYAVATWNFTLEPEDGGVRLATETRVRCPDEASRRSFRRYWRLVGPFSALTRREMLRTLRKAAEAE